MNARLTRELVVETPDKVGMMEQVFSSLANQHVNVEAVSAWGEQGKAFFRLIVSDVEKARRALHAFKVEEKDVVAVELENQPGEGAKLAKKLAQAGLNLTHLYGSVGSQGKALLVFRCNDNLKAVQLLK